MPFSPWLALGAVLAILAAFVAGNWHGAHAKDAEWHAKWNKFQADQFALAADATEKARAAEAANAATSATLEKERHDADIATADADRRVRDALRLRRAAGACGHNVPKTDAADGAAGVAAGSGAELPDRVDEFVADCARSANVLAGFVRECNAWVGTLPR